MNLVVKSTGDAKALERPVRETIRELDPRLPVSGVRTMEEVLAAHPGCPMHVPELCMAVGVPERTLRACCEEFLGMGPQRYLRLRRMKMARGELRRADPATTSVATIARQCGFANLGRFAVTYRTWFGETPSTTLRGGSFRAH